MLRKTTASFKNSMQSLLSVLPQSAAVREGRIEEIRQAMIDCLGDSAALRYPQLERRIRFSVDVEGLWFLRGDVLSALASTYGEPSARKRLDRVTLMFKGLIPDGLNSRPTPLGD